MKFLCNSDVVTIIMNNKKSLELEESRKYHQYLYSQIYCPMIEPRYITKPIWFNKELEYEQITLKYDIKKYIAMLFCNGFIRNDSLSKLTLSTKLKIIKHIEAY